MDAVALGFEVHLARLGQREHANADAAVEAAPAGGVVVTEVRVSPGALSNTLTGSRPPSKHIASATADARARARVSESGYLTLGLNALSVKPSTSTMYGYAPSTSPNSRAERSSSNGNSAEPGSK